MVRKCIRLIRQMLWKHNIFRSTTFQKLDGIEERWENPKLGKTPNFRIMEFSEDAGGSGNMFHQGQNSTGVY